MGVRRASERQRRRGCGSAATVGAVDRGSPSCCRGCQCSPLAARAILAGPHGPAARPRRGVTRCSPLLSHIICADYV